MRKIYPLLLLALINNGCMVQSRSEFISGIVVSNSSGMIEIAASSLPGKCIGHEFPEAVIEIVTQMEELSPGRLVELAIDETDPVCPAKGKSSHVISAKESSSIKVSPQLAHELLAENQEIRLVDVRLLPEYLQSHIPNSERITYLEEDPEAFIRLVEKEIPDKESIIMVYCRTGRRSNAAAQLLTQSGYSNVLDLGGIEEWEYETEKGN